MAAAGAGSRLDSLRTAAWPSGAVGQENAMRGGARGGGYRGQRGGSPPPPPQQPWPNLQSCVPIVVIGRGRHIQARNPFRTFSQLFIIITYNDFI